MSDGVWLDEPLHLAGLEPCEPCQGKGAVALPAFAYSSAFGRVHTEPKVVACPICSSTGTV